MKLYVWTGRDVLVNYGSGHAIAFAESLDQARNMLREQILDYYDWLNPEYEDDRDMIQEKIGFLGRDPNVYETAVSFAIQGSD